MKINHPISQSLWGLGRGPGLVVVGGDSRSGGRGFES